MSDSEPNLRQRKVNASQETEKPVQSKVAARVKDEDEYSPWLDIVRVLSFLFVASCALSYMISSGESFFWGMQNPPKYLQKQWWKTQFV